MDENRTGGNLISGSYGILDIQGSLPPHHQHHHSLHQQNLQDVFPFSSVSHDVHDAEHQLGLVASGHKNSTSGDWAKNCTSDEDEPSYNEDECGKGKKNSPWHRMKWTNGMVKLLITIVSYIGEDIGPDSGRRKFVLLQKKGKWKVVSKVMASKGCYVSPQQCEDKFNDLNKRYKRLTDVLGRGTSCKVVENPTLLNSMNLSEKVKEDVRKTLSSKHLFYEEMCSYHNGNRLHLLDDPSIQQNVQSVLNVRDVREAGKAVRDYLGGNNDQDDDDSDDDGDETMNLHIEDGLTGVSQASKRMRFSHSMEDMNFWSTESSHECRKQLCSENDNVGEMNETMQRQWLSNRRLQLEEQRLNIQAQTLALENQRFKWQRFSRKKEKELDKYWFENEKMKLENERMMLELKKKELDMNFNRLDGYTAAPSPMADCLQRREQGEMDKGHNMR